MQLLRWCLLALVFTSSACRVTELSSLTDQDEQTDKVTVAEPEISPELSAEQKYPYRPARTRYHDLLHTRLEVSFDIDAHTLDGIATLQLQPYFLPRSQLLLDAKGFDIHQIVLFQEGKEMPLEYKYNGLKLDITLDRTYQRDEDFIVKIKYTARPDELESQGSAAITKDKGLYFVGTDTSALAPKPLQIWTQGETQANSCWFPTIDAPNERSTQETYITVDTTFQTLSNGVLVYSQYNDDHTRTDYWKMDQPHAPYLFMMAVGDFAVVEDYWQEIPLSYYVEPQHAEYARDIFGHTPEMMAYFSSLLGVAYPWDKYAQVVVLDFVSGAMENTTASVFMEDLQVDDRELLDYHWDGIIAHELFHHWFGNLVTCESWANLPLNESFATYSEYLWYDYKYGKDEADYVLWEQGENYFTEAEEKKVDLIRFHYADHEEMFDRHSYDKGSRILHMLRYYLGDEAFFASLQHYLKKHAYTAVEVHDLRLAFEEVCGQDLNWFFSQWFLESGHPVIEVTHTYDSGKLYVQTRQVQDLAEAPLYYLPTTIEIWQGRDKKHFPLEIDEAENEWVFELQQRPDLVLVDPENVFLMDVRHEKAHQEWLHQASHAENFVRRYQALEQIGSDSLTAHEMQVLRKALQDEYWMVRQATLNLLESQTQQLSSGDVALIRDMAMEDEKSLVRADAISVLAALDADRFTDVFRSGMQDSSYAVVGSSIAAYTLSSADDKVRLFVGYEDYTNFNVVIALADYYVEADIPGKSDWFTQKFVEINDEALYYLLNYFARYLIDLPYKKQQDGIQVLADYARFHSKYYIRLNAYRSLSFFDEQEAVQNMKAAIRADEKDQRLRDIYESIP